MISGLIARINQSLGKPVGDIHSYIYASQNVFRDITVGNNGDYSAGAGYDMCTGLGVPNGTALLNYLKTVV